MFVTQAVIEIAIARFEQHQESNSWINKDKLLKTMKQAAQNLQQYYQLFHSIRWNRARKQVKSDLETQLLAIAEAAYQNILFVGEAFNAQAQKQIDDVFEFNQLVQLLQEVKMLVEIHHLNNRVTKVNLENTVAENHRCIPGLEDY